MKTRFTAWLDRFRSLPSGQWPRAARWLVSVLIVWHVAAIVVAPLSAEPCSQLELGLWRVCRPYLEATHLNHGYRFFAPEPGPSHLVRYEVTLPDGTQRRGFFPDTQQHRPRLLYHRHFMLSESLNTLIEAEAPPAVIAAYSASFAQRILAAEGGKHVKLFLVRHLIPNSADVLAGQPLDHASLYRERLLGEWDAPAGPGS